MSQLFTILILKYLKFFVYHVSLLTKELDFPIPTAY